MKPMYSVVIPVYNEEEVIQASYNALKQVMDTTEEVYELLFVNDGSRDRSVEILSQIASNDSNVKIINFSRNFGHQIAITAGMDIALGDAVFVIDADLQDPPEVMLKMIEKWKEGYEVVYGKRLKREGETVFKKTTAKAYYRLMSRMTSVDIPVDTGDFRLIDRKVCNAMKIMKEKNRYVRGLVAWVGYRQTAVEYVRHERFAGVTKYPLKKMLKFAFDGITSFSNKPLKLAYALGLFISGLSFLYFLFLLVKIGLGYTVFGWMPAVTLILFVQGLGFMLLGLIGDYIGRLYDEAKDRPLYLISEIIDRDYLEGTGKFNEKDNKSAE